MPEIDEGAQQLIDQLVVTQIPAEVELIDKKLAVLQKYKG